MTTTINGLPINQAVGSDGVKSNEIDFGSGAELKIGGVAATGVTAAGLRASTPTSACVFFDDFLGDTLKDELELDLGGGTGNAVALSPGRGGRLSIKTASDDAAITANASAIALGALEWSAAGGGLFVETRIQFDVVATGYCFIGFTDVLPGTTLEAPISLNSSDVIISDAANACGVAFDADGATKTWFHGGVKANTDTTAVFAAGPVIDTYYTVRVEVSAAGAVQGFINGVAIGPPVANAVTAATLLAPVVVVSNRTAAAVTALVDYLWVQADR